MVYRRRFRGRRHRRPFRGRGRGRVRSMKRVARRVVNRMIETKILENSLYSTYSSVSTAGQDGQWNPPAGTSYGTRIGREIVATYFKFRGLLHGGQSNLATDDSHNIFRIVIFTAEGGYTASSSTISTNNFIDPGKGIYRQIRKVYYDRTFKLDSPGRDSTGYLAIQKEINIRLKLKFKVKYDDTNVPNKSLHVFMISDSALPVNPGFTDGQARLYFKDA